MREVKTSNKKARRQKMKLLRTQRNSDERGSLALEHVLFIGAVVAISAGLFVFYGRISTYFSNIDFATAPTGIGASNPSSNP